MGVIEVGEFGGSEVLDLAEHQAENTYPAPQRVPFVPGAEVVGRDPDGSRVAALVAGGGYGGRAVAVREAVVPVPDEVDDASALVLLLQAATAYHVLRTSAALRQGESVVVMAGAGELRTVVGGTYSLSEARRAHEDLRARRTTGKLVLDPSR